MTGRFLRLFRYLSLRDFLQFWKSLIKNRKILRQMVKRDFRKQYLGSFLGVFWAFIQPLVFVLALWFVFATGLRQMRGNEPVPFVLWLMTGIFFWFFFSGSIQTGTSCILESSYLVKRVKFQVSLLPIVKIMSGLIVHIMFVLLLMVLFIVHGIRPNLYWLQIVYYLAATGLLVLGVAWVTSSMNVFVKDTGPFVNIVVRIGFWLTPVFWNVNRIPEKFRFFIKLNPAYYLVQGYRDSLIYKQGFWEYPALTLYFWTVTLLVFIAGAVIFKRLRPHFADVL